MRERGKLDATVIGIDVSKDNFPPVGGIRRAPLDIAVLPHKDVFSPSRDAAGLDALIARLVPLAPKAVAVEATGGFETVVVSAAGGAAVVSGCGGLPVVVVNPAEVRPLAQALGKRAKTDPIDAMVIAHFAEATKPKIRPHLHWMIGPGARLETGHLHLGKKAPAGRSRQALPASNQSPAGAIGHSQLNRENHIALSSYQELFMHRPDVKIPSHSAFAQVVLSDRCSATIAARTASIGDVTGGIWRTAKNRRFSLPSIGDDHA
jgi:transposase